MNQKLENLLNLSLSVTKQERARSQELETGFDPETDRWELIVKYSGSLDEIRALGVGVEEMRNEYAILTVREEDIERISTFPQIEYIEKPKRLFFEINQAKAASCVNRLQETPQNLTGKGVIVAILDSGIDYFHEDFRNDDGSTRILELWDQGLGRVFTREDLNAALELGSRAAARAMVPSTDVSGHGTAVAGIATGNGRASGGVYRGIAYESDLLVVKLAIPRENGFPRTTELMRAVNYAVGKAVEWNRPLAINISFGNTYGSHDGSSLLETFLNDIGNYGRTTICVGSGNEGAAAGHISGILAETTRSERARTTGQVRVGNISRGAEMQNGTTQVELSVAPYETGLSVQLWKSYVDQFSLVLQAPSGERFGLLLEQLGTQRFRYGTQQVLVYYGKPSPYSQAQEIYFDFIPDEGTFLESGIWRFELTPQRIVEGRYDFWLPSAGILNASTQFFFSTPDTTLTIPSTAEKVLTVGAYDSRSGVYADFSGRGFTRRTNQIKPELVAPGVRVTVPRSGGGYEAVTGTSFAAPVVTGSAALLMEWGIVNGNDPFLYGEKVKAYLQRGAKKLPAFLEYPNPQVGYGALCVADSLPEREDGEGV